MQVGIEPEQFEQIERDYQRFLNELIGDSSLERFRVEYEKLHKSFK